MSQLAETALLRLRNWEISTDQLERLRQEGKPQQQLLLKAPADGVVLEKTAIQGMRFMPGEMLYRIADLSSLWLVVDVFEQDLNLVHPGQEARITVNAFPGELFLGKVAFIYPTLNPQTRTAQVRVELPNPKGRLRPAMYASGDAEMDLLADILADGRSSRLYRGLVHESGLAVEVSAGQMSQRLSSLFVIEVTPAEGHTLAEAEEAIAKELARLAAEGPTDAELERVKNQLEMSFLERQESLQGRASSLNSYYFNTGTPGYMQADLDRYRQATKDGVKQAAARLTVDTLSLIHI